MNEEPQLENFNSRVEKAFSPKQSSELPKEYLARIQETLDRIEDHLRNATSWLIILTVAFESFSRAIISEVSLGPFKINDLSIIHKAIPVLVAYYFFDLSSLIDRRSRLRVLHKAILDHINKSISENKLDKYLIPRFNLIFYTLDYQNNKPLEKLQTFLAKSVAIFVLVILPITFESYAYYRLFTHYGFYDFVSWASIVITFILLLQGYTIYLFDIDR